MIDAGQNAAEFLAADIEIVRPFEIDRQAGRLFNRFRQRDTGRQRQQSYRSSRIGHRTTRRQNHRHVQAAAPWRKPAVAAASTSCGLFVSDDDGSLGMDERNRLTGDRNRDGGSPGGLWIRRKRRCGIVGRLDGGIEHNDRRKAPEPASRLFERVPVWAPASMARGVVRAARSQS